MVIPTNFFPAAEATTYNAVRNSQERFADILSSSLYLTSHSAPSGLASPLGYQRQISSTGNDSSTYNKDFILSTMQDPP